MKKVIVLLVLMSVSMTAQAKQTEICKLKEKSGLRDMTRCKKGDILRYYGFFDKTNLIVRTGCDFAQARSEERRVGKECAEPFTYGWAPYH